MIRSPNAANITRTTVRILPAPIVFHASPASTASNASAIHFRAGLLSSSNNTVLK